MNLRIRDKILLLVILPMVVLIYYFAEGALSRLYIVREIRELQSLSMLSVKAGNLVHELQKERGITNGFIGSSGKRFGKELSSQKAETDRRIMELGVFLPRFEDDSYPAEIRSNLYAGRNRLNRISEIRDAAASMRITAEEAFDYYTELNSAFLRAMERMPKMVTNAEISNLTSAYVNLLLEKEKAGMERGLLSNVFSAGRFTQDGFTRFVSILSSGETYHHIFSVFATGEQRDFYRDTLKGDFLTDLDGMRKAALQAPRNGDFGIDPEHWFRTMTIRIDRLKKVEDRLVSDLLVRSEALAGNARSSLVFYILISLIGLCITLGLTYLLCRDIRHSLAAVVEVVDNIADGDITKRIEHFPLNEIGVLARSVNKMAGSLNDTFSSMLLSVKGLLLSAESLKERLRFTSERIHRDDVPRADMPEGHGGDLTETAEITRELDRCISKMKYQVDALTNTAAELRDSAACFKIMRFSAHQAEVALGIASRTLPVLREGLNGATAAETAQIILEMTDLDAVQITDGSKILAHAGLESDREYHKPGRPIISTSTRNVLLSGEMQVLQSKCDMGCGNDKCSLNSAITVPLRKDDTVIGALKLHRIGENAMSPLDAVLANGLAHLFSNQIELAEVENQVKLAKEAEIRALQAQIKPHFIFNAINTIVSYMRTDPETASGLLIKLAEFFRRNISPADEEIPLSREIEHCEAYLSIEKARFGERVRVKYALDPSTLNCPVPPLTLQPLVENALKHGILPDEKGGEIVIGSSKRNGTVKIFVKDDGVGMSREKLESLFTGRRNDSGAKGSGIALKNINARLTALYGYPLYIESAAGKGTTVHLTIPSKHPDEHPGIHN